MKKISAILVSILSVFLMAGAAQAANITWGSNTKVHYNFSLTTTEGCASCHVTHTASVAKLLWGSYNGAAPATQTAFCYVCHSGVSMSPYDVEAGRISTDNGSTLNDSWAGKFAFNAGSVTSRHDVENTSVAVVADRVYNQIPGNALTDVNGTIKGGFKCASCHDPHAGDKANDRMLREKPLNGNSAINGVNFNFNLSNLTVQDYAYDLAGNQALNSWCGQCHGKFDKGDNAGKVKGGDTHFRHPMNVPVDPASVSVAVYLGKKGAANSNANFLNCLTCHRAHGTTVSAAPSAWWYADNGSVSDRAYTSTLLRLDKRGVCYDCHGAADKNTEAFGQSLE